jgi:hypothetical protein
MEPDLGWVWALAAVLLGGSAFVVAVKEWMRRPWR